jgi:hypothetical protein
MKAYKITEEQKDLLVGKEYSPLSYFYPIQDINDEWFIFEVEVQLSPKPEYDWLLDLEESEFKQKIYEIE